MIVKTEQGAVLGIDVGWSKRQPTTGLCLIEWADQKVSVHLCRARDDESDRLAKLHQLVQGRQLLAVGIDGPLTAHLGNTTKYRAAEALLSRGPFQKRGKPGPTKGQIGQRLHREATCLAKLAVKLDVAAATYCHQIHEKAIVEAFPNAFLSVLHPDEGFPCSKAVKRRWTDHLFPRVQPQLSQLLGTLLPRHRPDFRLDSISGHEDIASFVCALTALCAVFAWYVAVGDSTGYITLPPSELWGRTSSSNWQWARDALCETLASVRTDPRRSFRDVVVYKDNKPWIARS